MSDLHIFGIRHHGPGSARSTLAALKNLKPDILLVEGPPDAENVLPLLIDEGMYPPVSLLIYAEDTPEKAVYYPFTTFSPEYQAICYALMSGIPVRLMDLPQRHQFLLRPDPVEAHDHDHETPDEKMQDDPLGELAKAAGYDDTERWWDMLVEQRQDSTDLFTALNEAMSTLRELMPREDRMEQLREASMRRIIQQARDDGYQRIAIVCGAWHTPALHLPYTDEDAQRLSALASMSVSATWVPWTYTRLSRSSGYGAGVQSPGWYRFLWETSDTSLIPSGWLTKVAKTLRKEGLDASPAQIIDAVRLVNTLVAMRGRTLPDLHDLNEAVLSVLCHGNEAPLRIIARDLIVGSEMGRVPVHAPRVPLQRNFMSEVNRLLLPLSEDESDQILDLRENRDREISRLLYRLHLLDIPWGTREDSDFMYEAWVLKWDPVLVIKLIEHSVWGNTLHDAATGYALHLAQTAKTLLALTELVEGVLLADLPQAVPGVVSQLEAEAATTGDIAQLMAALPPLINSLSYGDIRRTPTDAIRRVVDSMIVRILIGLPSECTALADDAAAIMLESVIDCDMALRLLDKADVLRDWHAVLLRMFDQNGIHGLLRGRFCRIVLDARMIEKAEAVRQMRLALARVVMPEEAAAWLRGFLQESGMLLVHDEMLLEVMDQWVCLLTTDEFERILPLLRRTIATFEEPEVRQIGQRISGKAPKTSAAPVAPIDPTRAQNIDALLTDLLGLKGPDDDSHA